MRLRLRSFNLVSVLLFHRPQQLRPQRGLLLPVLPVLLVDEAPDLLQLFILLLLTILLCRLRRLTLRLRPEVQRLAGSRRSRPRSREIRFRFEKVEILRRRSSFGRRLAAGNALEGFLAPGRVLLASRPTRRRGLEVEVVVLVSLDRVQEAAELVEKNVVAGTGGDGTGRRKFGRLKIEVITKIRIIHESISQSQMFFFWLNL